MPNLDKATATPDPTLTLSGTLLRGSGVGLRASPNHGGPFMAEPDLIVLHYTAGPSTESAVSHMCKPETQASAHFVVGRSGQIVQLVPTDTIAWHAGLSSWGKRRSLNNCSIGIEIVNAGELDPDGQTWYGAIIPPRERIATPHRSDGAPSHWHAYTDEQVDAVERLCIAIQSRYDIAAILGHDDIAPGRKRDPGPAFPIAALRASLGLAHSQDWA